MAGTTEAMSECGRDGVRANNGGSENRTTGQGVKGLRHIEVESRLAFGCPTKAANLWHF